MTNLKHNLTISLACICSSLMVAAPISLMLQPERTDLAALVVQADKEAQAYHAANDVKPVILYTAKEMRAIRIMTKEQKRVWW